MAGLLRRGLPPVLFLAALLAGWEGWVRWRNTRSYLLPAPTRVATALWDTREVLRGHVATTVTETALGVVLGAALGVALAVAVASAAPVRRVLEPLLVASQTIPLIVLAPLLVYWFGFGMTPKVVVVILIVFFPVAVSTAAGLAGAEREQIDLVRSLGAGRLAVLRLVLVPSALPAFFSGLRISAAYAVAGATLGELIGGRSGLGIYIARSQRAFRFDQILAGVVVVATLSAALFGLIHVLGRLATPWRYVSDGSNPGGGGDTPMGGRHGHLADHPAATGGDRGANVGAGDRGASVGRDGDDRDDSDDSVVGGDRDGTDRDELDQHDGHRARDDRIHDTERAGKGAGERR